MKEQQNVLNVQLVHTQQNKGQQHVLHAQLVNTQIQEHQIVLKFNNVQLTLGGYVGTLQNDN